MRTLSEVELAQARREVGRHKLKMAAPYIKFVLAGAACLLVIAVVTTLSGRQRDADFVGAPLQSGTAVVSSKFYTYTKTGGFLHVRLLFQGRQMEGGGPSSQVLAFINVGDVVPITYRIGKSGSIELVDWQAPPRRVSLKR